MYQYTKLEQEFTKQKPMLEIDFLLDSGATLNQLNGCSWNKIKYNNQDIYLEKANKIFTSAKNTTMKTVGTVKLSLTLQKKQIVEINKSKHSIFISM